jgi:hypothetical protein
MNLRRSKQSIEDGKGSKKTLLTCTVLVKPPMPQIKRSFLRAFLQKSAAFLPLLSFTPADAGTAPRFLPGRDVAVSYTVSAPGRADAGYLLEYDAAGQRARINNPALGNYFLVNLPAGTAQLVVPAFHSVVSAPDVSALTQQVTSAGNARFTPLGHGRYAGLPCDKYLVLNTESSGVACLTGDGVILYFSGKNANGSATVTATAVAYGRQPAQDFTLPDGFTAINLPPGALAQLLGQ